MTARLDPAELIFPVGLAAAAIAIGVLAGIEPIAAIAVAGGLALTLLTLANLTVGLCGFVLLSFLELVPSLTGPALSLSKAAGAVLFISWLASSTALGKERREFPVVHPILTAALGLLLGWTTLSLLWAEDATRIPLASLSFALNFALFPIVFAGIRTTRSALYIFGAFAGGAALAAAIGIFTQPSAATLEGSPTAATGLNRLAGTFGDPNEFATILTTGIALSTALILGPKRNPVVRSLAVAAAAVMVFAVLLTLSRGGLVSLAAVILTGVLVVHRYRARAIMGAVAVGLIALAFFSANPEAQDRVTAADGGSGRTDIWKIGWRMVEDEPVLGVGAANFQVASIHYLLVPGGIRFDEYVVDQPQVAHNMYLQVLAELGIVGLVLFMAVVGACVAMAFKAYRAFAARGDRDGEVVAAATLMATAALLAGYFFLSEQNSKHLWLMLAMGPTLLAIARARPAESKP